MILRRIMQHVKDQNWFAVGLDLGIVVIGVFLGFQVTEWNDQRNARATANGLLTRLHDEVVDIQEARLDWPASGLMLERLRTASLLLYGEALPGRELSASQCAGIVQSHIMNPPPISLPVLDELEANGGIQLIDDPAVRASLTDLIQQNDRATDVLAAVNNNAANIASAYPDLVQFALPSQDQTAQWDPVFDNTATCDLQAMRANRSFLNRFADNYSRYLSYERAVRTGPNIRLAELHAALDKVLSADHSGTTP